MNQFLLIPEYQRRKAIPKPNLDIIPLPFNKGFDNVLSHFIGDDDLRPIMQGIFFNVEEKQICATNAHVLIRLKMPESTAEVVQTGVYKTRAKIEKEYANLIKRVPDAAKELPFEKFFSDRKNITIDGKFPNYNAVIPIIRENESHFLKEVDFYKLYYFLKVMVDAKLLKEDLIDSLSDKTEYQKGIISPLKSEYISLLNEKTHQIVFRATVGGEKVYYGFNAEFFLDAITSLLKLSDNRFRKIYLTEPSRASAIQVGEGEFDTERDSVALVMPIMLGSNPEKFLNDYLDKEFEIVYDLDENMIFSGGKLYPIDESVGFEELKKVKVATPKINKEPFVWTPELLRKRIQALQIALRLAEKK